MIYTKSYARDIATVIREALTDDQRRRLKSIHIHTRIHDGMMTIRVFMKNSTADDPEPYIFHAEDL